MKALFSKHIVPRCVYCKRGIALDSKEIACTRHGVVQAYDQCRSFAYDPLKRTPPRHVKFNGDYKSEDFSL